jgi:hypothetical protein
MFIGYVFSSKKILWITFLVFFKFASKFKRYQPFVILIFYIFRPTPGTCHCMAEDSWSHGGYWKLLISDPDLDPAFPYVSILLNFLTNALVWKLHGLKGPLHFLTLFFKVILIFLLILSNLPYYFLLYSKHTLTLSLNKSLNAFGSGSVSTALEQLIFVYNFRISLGLQRTMRVLVHSVYLFCLIAGALYRKRTTGWLANSSNSHQILALPLLRQFPAHPF